MTETAAPLPQRERHRTRFGSDILLPFLRKWGTPIGIMILCVFFAAQTSIFMRTTNLLNIVRQSATITLIAYGLTFVVAVGQFDISLGAIAGTAGVFGTYVMAQGQPFAVALLVALVLGAALGAVNGFAVARLRINDFLATVAMMFVAQGLDILVSKGTNVFVDTNANPDFLALGQANWGAIPIAVIVVLMVGFVCHALLNWTTFGHRVYAIGENRRVAFLSGIRVTRYVWLCFIIAGVLYAVGGMMLTARLGAGKALAGGPILGDAIAAYALGVTFLKGGKPHILGTLVGGLFVGIMANGFTLLNVPFYYQFITSAIAIVAAVSLSGSKKK
jgi:ribose/xylose/arabinose/galactoside ABC-type transport system permease subunit